MSDDTTPQNDEQEPRELSEDELDDIAGGSAAADVGPLQT